MLLYDQQTRLRIEEAARTIGVSLESAEALVMAGAVRYRRSGRVIFVAPSDLRSAHLENNTRPTAERRTHA